MQKRGFSQVDWIMSLAIFLLFIIWFFVFLIPSMEISSNKDTLLSILETKFDEEFSWQLRKFPLFIETNSSPRLCPVMVNYQSNNTDIKFMDDTQFVFFGKWIIFLANLSSDINTFWILEGGNYSVEDYQFESLNIEEDKVTTENMSLELENSMPDAAEYDEESKIDHMRYSINGINFDPVNASYYDFGFSAIYTANTENINHTTMVFAYNPEIYNLIEVDNPEAEYTFVISMSLDNYRNYYSSNSLYGSFGYSNTTGRLNFSTDYLTLYSGQDSLSMFFDTDVNFNFTYYNTTLSLKLEIPLSGEYKYKYVFHQGNYTVALMKSYSSRFGAIETLEGIYFANITSNYSYYKSKWNFPSTRDFNIRVFSNTSAYYYMQDSPLYEIGAELPRKSSIYSNTVDAFALDEDGQYTPLALNFRTW